MRLISLVAMISLFTFSTSTTELTHGTEQLLKPLQRIGLPAHEFSLVIMIALRFVPILALEAEHLVKAQASRGLDFGGGKMGILKRIFRMLPLLIPLFIAALRRAETLSLAMESRCYTGGAQRTHLVRFQARRVDYAVVLLFVLFLSLIITVNRADTDILFWNLMSRGEL